MIGDFISDNTIRAKPALGTNPDSGKQYSFEITGAVDGGYFVLATQPPGYISRPSYAGSLQECLNYIKANIA